MTVQLLHTGDLHFGGLADLRQIEALEAMVPDLRPDAVVVAGDLSQRARHGEFQRARAFVRAAQAVAPVLVIPGNHDIEWWRRPLIPFGTAVLTAKYRRYFGDDLGPVVNIPGAVIAAVHTSYGVAWGSLTTRVRDLAVKGHLPLAEALRAKQVFAGAPSDAARVLVVHHNVLRGDLSQRMGLARWRQAQRRLADTGADVILCGHDHQEGADVMAHKVVVSTCGTLCRRSRGGRPQSFNVVTIDAQAVQVTFFRWEAERGRFRSSDTFAFARAADVVRREGMVAGRAG